MDAQTRTNVSMDRLGHYYNIMRTSMFVLLGTLAVVVFGETAGAEMAIAAAVVAAGLYGILAGDRALSDLGALRSDMDEEDRATNYGRSYQAAPLPAYRAISALVYVAMVATQLMVLY